ncbi:dephospho-CoA kinase [Phyllobacterium sp. A18/5-2]|jgi:dephospho-CoA kinase|uniref:dephospho-CoA kinase n=1 Tax=Phyllobacterium sp. A18/5-2 TaxID=2978392 RepID=UPI0021C65BA4|nr:dephospho-CoA kinase [Phyllobacterium sp. A18/5-2]UXN65343.1 dephospho-CoA kinase [Phyllobacterium sp. A18/5-2]
MIVLGLTGSIGMGKSTSAQMFDDEGIPVYSADEAVHSLYTGAAVPLIEAAFPGTTKNGKVDRTKLSTAVVGKPKALEKLEAIIHPLVRAEENRFRDDAQSRDAKLIVLDIPLLFETGADRRVDKILVVTAPEDVQRKRVLERPGMTPEKFDAILARQTPDAEKRARADFIIDTRHDFDVTRAEVRKIIGLLSG